MSCRIQVRIHTDRELLYKLALGAPLPVKNAFRAIVQNHCTWNHVSRAYLGDLDRFPEVLAAFMENPVFRVDPAQGLLELITKRIGAIHDNARQVGAALEGSKLFDYQKEGVAFISSRKCCGLFDEMGLGKTVQAIMSIPTRPDAPCAPTIIVSPASVKGVWRKEIKKWRPDITKVFMLAGRDSFMPPEPGEVMILNYEILPSNEDLNEMANEGLLHPGTCLIADEIHATKNPNAKRTRAFRDLREAVVSRAGNCVGLTGTPLLNKGTELKEVCKSIGVFDEAFGTDRDFAECFDGYHNGNGTWIADYMCPQPALAQALATVSLRRLRRKVQKQLPAKIYGNDIQADPPTGEAAKLCDEALADPMIMEALDSLETEDAFGGMGALSKARKALAICKIPKLLEVIQDEYEANEEPVIVFSAHRAPIDVLAKRPGWITITGNTSVERRSEIESEFQSGMYKGIAGTIRAMSEGLTLTHAAHVLFVDKDWTPPRNMQAEDRACRIGQNRGVNVRCLIADHELDEMIADCLERKTYTFNKSVNMIPDFKSKIEPIGSTGGAALQTADALQRVADLMEKAI